MYGDSPISKSGFGRELSNIYPVFQKAGHEVAYVALDYTGLPIITNIRVYPTKLTTIKDRWASPILEYAIRDFDPDIVLTLQDYYVLGSIGFELANPGRFKWVHWSVSDAEGLSFLAREGVKWIHQHVFHSEFDKQQIQKFYPKIDGSVIYSPIDDVFKKLNKVELRKKYKLDNVDVLVNVARPQERKLVPHLLEAFKLMLQKKPNIILILAVGSHKIANDQGKEVGTMIEKYILEFGLQDNVIIPRSEDEKNISDEILNIQYNLADINILCTSGEGFGLPFGEAAACGVPSIGVDNSAATELCAKVGWTVPKTDHVYTFDGTKGYLYNPQDLADKCLVLLTDKKEIEKRGEEARKFAETLRPELVGNRLLKVFEKAITTDKKRYVEENHG